MGEILFTIVSTPLWVSNVQVIRNFKKHDGSSWALWLVTVLIINKTLWVLYHDL